MAPLRDRPLEKPLDEKRFVSSRPERNLIVRHRHLRQFFFYTFSSSTRRNCARSARPAAAIFI
jgi:hypothetical protein